MQVVICDDNDTCRKKYSNILYGLAKRHNIELSINEYVSGQQLLFDYEDYGSSIDIFFLDINMPTINGIDVARKLKEYNCRGEIVFLSGSDEFVFTAFDVQAFNYLIKERHTEERFENVFLRAIDAVEEKAKEYMLFTGIGETRNVAINSIKYFEIINKIVTVHYNNETFEFVTTLAKLENLLFPYRFVRNHRSFLVSANFIKGFTSREIRLFDETVIPIGRRYYGALKEALKRK